jgi:hypothetical protein
MEWTVLHTFYDLMEAQLALNAIQAAGLDGFLQNENTSTLLPMLNYGAGGGIQLMVREEERHLAEQALESPQDNDNLKNTSDNA